VARWADRAMITAGRSGAWLAMAAGCTLETFLSESAGLAKLFN
jgi:hypothetical protein